MRMGGMGNKERGRQEQCEGEEEKSSAEIGSDLTRTSEEDNEGMQEETRKEEEEEGRRGELMVSSRQKPDDRTDEGGSGERSRWTLSVKEKNGLC